MPALGRTLEGSRSAFGHRDFRVFWFGGLVTNVARWIHNAAIPYVLFQLTGSASLVGAAAMIQYLPSVVLGPLGGSIADRLDRRSVLLVAQVARVVLAAGLWAIWATGTGSVPLLLVFAGLLGGVNGVNVPAWQAYAPELVPSRDLFAAVSLVATQGTAARTVGPALGGVLLATGGVTTTFFVATLLYTGVIPALLRIEAIAAPRVRPASFTGHLLESIRYVWAEKGIRQATVVVGMVAALGMPLVQLAPAFATDVHRVGASGYGVLVAVLGLGGVLVGPFIGSFGAARAGSRVSAVSIVAYGAALVAFGLAPSFPIAVAAIFVVGALFLVVGAVLNTTVHSRVAQEMRGRVVALFFVAWTAGYPLGALTQGALADRIGVRPTVVVAGCLMSGLGLVLATNPTLIARASWGAGSFGAESSVRGAGDSVPDT